MKHIAIVKLWALGDIVMCTPMLTAIKSRYPDCKITWIASNIWAPILENHPLIHEVIAIDAEHWRNLLRKKRLVTWFDETYRIRKRLFKSQFDVVINCHAEKWWTSPLNCANRRVGVFPGDVPSWAKILYTDCTRHVWEVPETENYLSATRLLGIADADYALTLGQTPDEEPFFSSLVSQFPASHSGPVVIIAPFSSAENKCWPLENIAALADRLYDQFKARVIMTMGPTDTEKAQSIQKMSKSAVVLAVGTNLRQYVGLIRFASMTVTMDSSALHISAAVGTPFVVLWGPTTEAKLAPRAAKGVGLRHPLPCAPCNRSQCSNPNFRECMELITVERVETAVNQVLALCSMNR